MNIKKLLPPNMNQELRQNLYIAFSLMSFSGLIVGLIGGILKQIGWVELKPEFGFFCYLYFLFGFLAAMWYGNIWEQK